MRTDWDYSDRAATYDKRADYSLEAITKVLKLTECSNTTLVADIGAGTGKLTKALAAHSLTVHAVEPNDNMRTYGKKNTTNMGVKWSEGIAEDTKLEKNRYHAAFFGSSFNVTDQVRALKEVDRILAPQGWFVCMWNHRDLNDPIQKRLEYIIHSYLPSYDYGARRQDPTDVIESSGYFKPAQKIECRFTTMMSKCDIIGAWKSHDTLFRQSDGKFDQIIETMEEALTDDTILVPYFTRIWFAQAIH